MKREVNYPQIPIEEERIEVPNQEEYYQPPQYQNYNDRGDMIEKIKPEKVAEIIRQKLLGKDLIDGKWVENPALKERKLTEVGAYEISNILLGASTINISISKLSDIEIKMRLRSTIKSLLLTELLNWKLFGIRNISQFYTTKEMVFTNTLAVLKQSENGSIQDLLKDTTKSNIQDYSNEKETAGKKFGRMIGVIN